MEPLFRFFLVVFYLLVSASATPAIGIGASPPDVRLIDGVGRLTLFNPGNEAISYSTEIEGEAKVRPARGTIPPLKAATIIVYGDGPAKIRVMAEPQGGLDTAMTVPGVEITVQESITSAEPLPEPGLPWAGILIGIGVMILLGIIVLAVVVLRGRSVIRPTTSDPITPERINVVPLDGSAES